MNSGVNGDTALEEAIEVLSSVPDVQEVPKPTPASTRKTDLYSDVNVFNELDEQVIRVRLFKIRLYVDKLYNR